MKKILFTLSLIGAMLAFAACSSKDDNGGEPDSPVVTQEKNLEVSADASEHTFDFTANNTWNANSNASWCKVSPSHGSAGNASIKVTIEANATRDARSAVVVVGTGMFNQAILKINVNQKGNTNLPDEPVTPPATYQDPEQEDVAMTADMSADGFAIANAITVGWNLGNTCEGSPNETSWGNPKTTPELIAAVRAAGFNAIRVPVRWDPHADADLNIKEDWLGRIKEIVDYAYAQDMYVIINSHHDQWYDRLEPGYNETEIFIKYGNMWTQIARYFRDYDHHLMFAGVNEIVTKNASGVEDWGQPSKKSQDFCNKLMQIFVDRVRATSGNNAERCLLIQPYACNFDYVSKTSFKMPNDKENVARKLIFEFHMYTWTYSTEAAGNDNKFFWGEPYKANTPWFANGEAELDWRFGEVKSQFLDKGVPAIMAEFGCVQHNKTKDESKADESRAYYLKNVVSKSRANGIPGFYWDNGLFTSTDNENFGLFDRQNGNVVPKRAQIALDGIMDGLK